MAVNLRIYGMSKDMILQLIEDNVQDWEPSSIGQPAVIKARRVFCSLAKPFALSAFLR
jgi:hypothetical protein